MDLGLTLNVAISLAFSYLLAALLASTVQEIIAGVFKLRGVYLTKAIEALTSLGTDNRFSWGGFRAWWHANFRQSTAEVTRVVDRAGAEVLRVGEAAATLVAASPGSVRAAMHAVAAIDMLPGLRRKIATATAPQPILDAVRKSVAQAVKSGDQTAVVLQTTADTAAAAAGATAVSVRDALAAVPAISLLTGLQQVIDDAVAAPASTADSVVTAVRPAGGIAAIQKHPLLVGTPSGLPSYVPSRDFASALLAQLADGSANDRFVQAEQAIRSLPDGDLRQTLLAFISAGADDLDKLRTRIESWFDDSMQRLSGIYTRFTWYVTLGLGLLIASVMNVDSVYMARTFWQEPALSATVAAAAQDYVKQHQQDQAGCPQPLGANAGGAPNAGGGAANPKGTAASTGSGAATTAGSAPNTPGTTSAATAATTAGDALTAATKCLSESVNAVQNAVTQLRLPIGRAGGCGLFGCDETNKNICLTDWRSIFWRVVGWLITALAVSLGAQFWFGMLKDFASLRTSGDKPQRADQAPAS